MKKIAVVLISAWCSFRVQGEIHVMFVGIAKEKSPLFGQRCEQTIRERLNAAIDVRPVDWAETERIAEKTGLLNFPNVSYSLVKSLQRFIPDSTLLVWGRIDNYTVEVKRRGIFRARVIGNALVVITLYNIQTDRYVFVGKAEAAADIRKPPAWFRRADLVTHISAQDRERIADTLSQKIAGRMCALISAVVRSIDAQAQESAAVREGGAAEPSIYEIFQIPPPEKPAEPPQNPAPEDPVAPQDSTTASPAGGAMDDFMEGLPQLPEGSGQ